MTLTMTHLNAIIIGSAIVVAGAVITFNLPRYQYAATIVRSVDSSGSEKVEERELVFDMVSAELHERQRLVLVFAPTNAVVAYGNVHKPTRPLDIWKRQREAFGDKFFNFKEWREWKANNERD